MTPEQRAACLRAAAIRYLAINDEAWERMSALERGMYIADMGRAMDGFFPAAAALPNPHKLVGREATEGMVAAAKELPVANTIDGCIQFCAMRGFAIPGFYDEKTPLQQFWTAAHDAAPEWDGVG